MLKARKNINIAGSPLEAWRSQKSRNNKNKFNDLLSDLSTNKLVNIFYDIKQWQSQGMLDAKSQAGRFRQVYRNCNSGVYPSATELEAFVSSGLVLRLLARLKYIKDTTMDISENIREAMTPYL